MYTRNDYSNRYSKFKVIDSVHNNSTSRLLPRISHDGYEFSGSNINLPTGGYFYNSPHPHKDLKIVTSDVKSYI